MPWLNRLILFIHSTLWISFMNQHSSRYAWIFNRYAPVVWHEISTLAYRVESKFVCLTIRWVLIGFRGINLYFWCTGCVCAHWSILSLLSATRWRFTGGNHVLWCYLFYLWLCIHSDRWCQSSSVNWRSANKMWCILAKYTTRDTSFKKKENNRSCLQSPHQLWFHKSTDFRW